MANIFWYVHCRFSDASKTHMNLKHRRRKMLYGMTTSSPIFGLRREIDRLFEDTFARDGNNWTPAVDIKESDNDI